MVLSPRKKTSIEEILLFTLFPATQIILLTAIVLKIMSNLTVAPVVFTCVMVTLCTISDIGIYRAVKEMGKKAELEQQAIFYKEQLDMQMAHYKSFSEYDASLSEVRQQLEQQVTLFQNALKTMDYSQASELLEHVEERIDELKPVSYCRNKIINALIFTKHQEMEDAGISFDYKLLLDDDIAIEQMDLFRVFSNILDNAIDACRQVKNQPSLSLECKKVKNILMIKSQNTFSGVLKRKKDSLPLSTKKGAVHGQGLKIIEEIAHKYDGEMWLETDVPGIFRITVNLTCY